MIKQMVYINELNLKEKVFFFQSKLMSLNQETMKISKTKINKNNQIRFQWQELRIISSLIVSDGKMKKRLKLANSSIYNNL